MKSVKPAGLVAHVSRKKLYIALAIAVGAYCVLYFFVDRFEMVVFGVCVAIAILYGIKEVFGSPARIVIDERGVLDSRLGLGTIRWSDITRVYVTEFQSITHICMDVTDPDCYLKRPSAAVRGVLKYHQKKNYIPPFNISTGVLDAGAEEIFDAVIEGWEFYSKQRAIR